MASEVATDSGAPHPGGVSLVGKVALITGSTHGLGVAIARALCAAGASIVVVGRNAAAGDAVVASLIQELRGKAIFCATDIERDDEIDRCIERAIAAFGRLDIVVNNACIYVDRGLASTRAEWHRTLGVNVVSAAIVSQKAAAFMQRGGVIVNLGSVAGKFGAIDRGPYPVSKAALMHLTKNLAATLAPRGIRVLSVSPAWTWSPALAGFGDGTRELADATAAPMHPLGRVGDAEEVAEVIAFLASEGASWITGVDIPVDGGFSVYGPDRGVPPRDYFKAQT